MDPVDAGEAYERLMVPALFGEWATTLADAAGVGPGDRVLDVACGTGVLTREVASRTGPTGFAAGVDANSGMLAAARRRAPELAWHLAVAEALPFADRSFHAVVCQFGLMFFQDRVAALREMVRVLGPQGRIAVAVWDSLDRIPAYAALVSMIERLAGSPAADALRAPFVLGAPEALGGLMDEAGVGAVRVTTAAATGRFPSARVMVEADVRGWLPLVGIVLSEEQIAAILHEADTVLAPFLAPDGRTAFTTLAHIGTGRRP